MPESAAQEYQTPQVGKAEKSDGMALPVEVAHQSGPGKTLRDRLSSGGLAPLMAYIPGGEFTMGQQRDSLQMDEQPVREVSLAGFAIGKYEVTFEEYQAFANATGRKMPGDNGWGRGRRPVINVSWNDAKAYTRWLSRQTGARYRLPTEAEWEFAARAGSDSFFWWGYELGENRASCFDCGSRWDAKSTAPVGSFAANAYSLNDTAGNVMEWVEDCYRDSYRGAPLDGSAHSQQGCTEQVARGGAYNKPGDSLHSTRRFHFHADTRLPTLGFRVARESRRDGWASN
ncbi:MAG: formylglycine-generating enzyme family protein [Gammaproteobacteria bacterium]|nr:formylglycine-generating enzyme family protein [Gammaproteobacteria bacterium]